MVPLAGGRWPPPTQPSSADASEPVSDSSHKPPAEPGSPGNQGKRIEEGESKNMNNNTGRLNLLEPPPVCSCRGADLAERTEPPSSSAPWSCCLLPACWLVLRYQEHNQTDEPRQKPDRGLTGDAVEPAR